MPSDRCQKPATAHAASLTLLPNFPEFILLPFPKKVTPKLPLDCASCKFSQKSLGSSEIPSLRSVSFRFLVAFLLVLKRCARIAAQTIIESGLRLVSFNIKAFAESAFLDWLKTEGEAGTEAELAEAEFQRMSRSF